LFIENIKQPLQFNFCPVIILFNPAISGINLTSDLKARLETSPAFPTEKLKTNAKQGNTLRAGTILPPNKY
jgi:hypothetical protein